VSPDTAFELIGAVGTVGTAFNMWLSSRSRADIAELKVWVMQHFVQKVDVDKTLHEKT
jgi:hypothetical protein